MTLSSSTRGHTCWDVHVAKPQKSSHVRLFDAGGMQYNFGQTGTVDNGGYMWTTTSNGNPVRPVVGVAGMKFSAIFAGYSSTCAILGDPV